MSLRGIVEKVLSEKETQVAIRVAATNLTNAQLAREFFVCEKTIKYHLTSIYKKLGIKNRAQLKVLMGPK